ncbi:hypothetical protein LP414_14030 [Polaromonas sp. P1(28)-13]|nr:hypothetical protein LP414_14030 [Polaromonas sp. P1(28)-13]
MIQLTHQPAPFSPESYPCPMWTSLLMTPGQAGQSLIWRGLRGVVPQIEAVGILCVNAVVSALSPPRMRDTPERLNELQN